MTINQLIKIGSSYLKQNNIKTHMIDTELILSSISGQTKEKIMVSSDFKLDSN